MSTQAPAPDFAAARRFIWGAAAIFLLLTLVRPIPSMVVDLLWFREVGFESVFWKRIGSQALLGLGFALTFLVLFLANVLVALRRGPTNVVVLHEMQVALPALEILRPKLRGIAILAGFLLAIPAGQWGVASWLELLRMLEAEAFAVQDPVFSRDLSFYVFTLPVWQTILAFLTFTLILTGIATALCYAVQGRIWARPGFLSVADGAKRHMLALGALGLVLLGLHDLLARFDLLSGGRGIVAGAGYADINVAMPGLTVAAIASFIGAVLLLVDSFRSSLRITVATLIVVTLVHLAAGELLPAAVQRFAVAPSELEQERPYLEREIEATRFAYALNDVEEQGFPATETLVAEEVARNAVTIDNLRLWESDPLKTTNQQLQEIRTYYDFVDVDHDRYSIGGNLRQVALSPRELNPAALPSRTWINEHFTYTHGYGVCVATVNEISPEGIPVYLTKDIPPVSTVPELEITRPEIYYGEVAADYVFVETRAQEFDYPSGDQNVYTRYDGAGGIRLDSFWLRVLFALHFVESKIVLSGDLEPQSRILIHRTVRDRVTKLVPFLTWEADPYMIIREDGSLAWMLDGYTTANGIPYSAEIPGLGNYIRNPVKAVVDAYHGTVRIYVVDPDDPLIRTDARIFPGLFSPLAEMPEDLRAHMRYPEGLFAIQARIYATYHMTDPQVFYNKEDLWKIANRSDGGRVQPYFTITKLAGLGESEEFILMLPFTPARKENMIAWMSARCDPPNYGKLVLFSFPKQKLVFGPLQIESRINQDTEISKELTLWNQQGSEVIRGNLLVIPIESSVVYFQPLYLKASADRGLPELKRIVVAFGNRIAMEPTMEAALRRVFGSGATDRSAVVPASTAASSTTQFEPSAGEDQEEIIQRAAALYERAQDALRRGDLAGYAREIEELGRVLTEANESR